VNVVKIEEIENRIITIRGEKVLIDGDVAEVYGVETKRVNEAVKNNRDKFPGDYLIELSQDEKNELVENFDRFNRLKHSTALPKAFTEKGLYMLATILKSKQATQTTFAIIETFARIRHLTRTLNQLTETEDEARQKALMQKSEALKDGKRQVSYSLFFSGKSLRKSSSKMGLFDSGAESL